MFTTPFAESEHKAYLRVTTDYFLHGSVQVKNLVSNQKGECQFSTQLRIIIIGDSYFKTHNLLTSHSNLSLVVFEIDLGQALWKRGHLSNVRIRLVLQRVERWLLRHGDLLGELGPVDGGRGNTAGSHLVDVQLHLTGTADALFGLPLGGVEEVFEGGKIQTNNTLALQLMSLYCAET